MLSFLILLVLSMKNFKLLLNLFDFKEKTNYVKFAELKTFNLHQVEIVE